LLKGSTAQKQTSGRSREGRQLNFATLKETELTLDARKVVFILDPNCREAFCGFFREISHDRQEREENTNKRESLHGLHDMRECVFFLS
jgi:hypothetical protein